MANWGLISQGLGSIADALEQKRQRDLQLIELRRQQAQDKWQREQEEQQRRFWALQEAARRGLEEATTVQPPFQGPVPSGFGGADFFNRPAGPSLFTPGLPKLEAAGPAPAMSVPGTITPQTVNKQRLAAAMMQARAAGIQTGDVSDISQLLGFPPEKAIGPTITVTPEMAQRFPDLEPGWELTPSDYLRYATQLRAQQARRADFDEKMKRADAAAKSENVGAKLLTYRSLYRDAEAYDTVGMTVGNEDALALAAQCRTRAEAIYNQPEVQAYLGLAGPEGPGPAAPVTRPGASPAPAAQLAPGPGSFAPAGAKPGPVKGPGGLPPLYDVNGRPVGAAQPSAPGITAPIRVPPGGKITQQGQETRLTQAEGIQLRADVAKDVAAANKSKPMTEAARQNLLIRLRGEKAKLQAELRWATMPGMEGIAKASVFRSAADIRTDLKATTDAITRVSTLAPQPKKTAQRGSWGDNFSKLPVQYRAWAQNKRAAHESDSSIRQHLIAAGVSW